MAERVDDLQVDINLVTHDAYAVREVEGLTMGVEAGLVGILILSRPPVPGGAPGGRLDVSCVLPDVETTLDVAGALHALGDTLAAAATRAGETV